MDKELTEEDLEELSTKTSLRQSFRFSKDLFRDSFRRGGAYSEESNQFQESLYNRAWLIHSMLMFSRIAWPLMGIAVWEKAYTKES